MSRSWILPTVAIIAGLSRKVFSELTCGVYRYMTEIDPPTNRFRTANQFNARHRTDLAYITNSRRQLRAQHPVSWRFHARVCPSRNGPATYSNPLAESDAKPKHGEISIFGVRTQEYQTRRQKFQFVVLGHRTSRFTQLGDPTQLVLKSTLLKSILELRSLREPMML